MKSDNTLTIIAKIHKSMNAMLIAELKNAGIIGIVPSHGAILLELFDGCKLSMNELAEKIGKTPQTVTTLVKKLENMGYVQNEKYEADRRTTMVFLTEKGQNLKPVFVSASEKLYTMQYAGLSANEISELRRMLQVLQSNFN